MTEKDFSLKLRQLLRDTGANVTSIETNATVNGIPDLFVQMKGDDLWLELKLEKRILPYNKIEVKWRPGQQGWSLNYRQWHHKAIDQLHFSVKHTFTLVMYDDALVLIQMHKVFQDNCVLLDQPGVIVKPFNGKLNKNIVYWLVDKLQQYTYTVTPDLTEYKLHDYTYVEMVNNWIEQYVLLYDKSLLNKLDMLDAASVMAFWEVNPDDVVRVDYSDIVTWNEDVRTVVLSAIESYRNNGV